MPEIVVAGCSHRTAPAEVRDRIAFRFEELDEHLAGVARLPGVREVVILSTCNRSEIYAVTAEPDALTDTLERFLAGRARLPVEAARHWIISHRGENAVRYLLRVAAGVESMILGETQIVGQIKDAFAVAETAGTVGPALRELLQRALHVAKRARASTDIGSGAQSVASIAVERGLASGPARGPRRVLILGAGKTARLVAKHAAAGGAAPITIVNRTVARAEELAVTVGARALPLAALDAGLLAESDVVFSAVRATQPLIHEALLAGAARRPAGRPLVLVDLSVPSSIAAGVAALEGVVLHTLGDLHPVADAAQARRAAAIPAAEGIVEEELEALRLRRGAATDVVRSLRERFEAIRATEVARHSHELGPAEHERFDRLTRQLLAKLLHEPSMKLKEGGGDAALSEAAQRLFALHLEPGLDPAITIGTRGSELALWQADCVAARLSESCPAIRPRRQVVKTTGDRILDAPLAKIGDKGLFTKELEAALLEGRVDLVVHSLKDLPTRLPDGLVLAAVLRREDPRDVLVSRHGTLDELPAGARVGTSSLRRRAHLLALRPDLAIVDLRGNVPGRLRSLEDGRCDAVVLARAGLERLGLGDRITEVLEPERVLPAVGQGAIAVEMRQNDPRLAALAAALDHRPTRLAVAAERALLRALEGGCQVPIGALGAWRDGWLELEALVSDVDGSRRLRASASGAVADEAAARALGEGLAACLLDQGAAALLATARRPAAAHELRASAQDLR